MFSIEKESKNEIIINKSRFINYLFKLDNLDDVEKHLDFVKNKHKDATHYCYAYIFLNIKRFNDDSEPSGTAGMPLLKVLESHNLDQILTITVRYFGGIKLGTGGLTRAYTKSVTENLKISTINEYVDGFNFDISVSFNQKNMIEKRFNNINNITYNNLVNYNISIKEEDFNETKMFLSNNFIDMKNIKKCLIAKKK